MLNPRKNPEEVPREDFWRTPGGITVRISGGVLEGIAGRTTVASNFLTDHS